MSLKISLPNGPYARFGVLLFDAPKLSLCSPYWQAPAYLGDVVDFLTPIIRNSIVDVGYLRCDAACGIVSPQPPLELQLQDYAPYGYDYNYASDLRRFGSLATTISALDAHGIESRVGNSLDNEVQHTHYDGSGTASSSPNLTLPGLKAYDSTYDWFGLTFPVFQDGVCNSVITWDKSVPSSIGSPDYDNIPKHFLTDALDVLKSGVAAGLCHRYHKVYSGTRNANGEVLSFDYTIKRWDNFTIAVECESEVRVYVWDYGYGAGNCHYTRFNVHIDYSILVHLMESPSQTMVDGPLPLAVQRVRYTAQTYGSAPIEGGCITPLSTWSLYTADHWSKLTQYELLLCESETSSSGNAVLNLIRPERSPIVPGSLLPRISGHVYEHTHGYYGALANFHDNVTDDASNILPSIFYSTQNAVSSFLDIIKTNHIQDILDLLDLAGFLPGIQPIAKLLLDVKRMKLLDAGGDLLDILTEADLLYQFGWRPTMDSVQEFSEKFSEVRQRLYNLQSTGGSKTFYGSFHYTLPEGVYGISSAPLLVSRSKIRCDVGSSFILSSLLSTGARAVGLAPLIEGLWDIIPFSFVVDWFLNIGGRIHDVEDAVVMATIPIVSCTHSIKISNTMSPELMGDIGIVPTYPAEETTFPSLVYYYRMLSGVWPPLRESKYDFRAAYGVPSAITAGSLLVQLLL